MGAATTSVPMPSGTCAIDAPSRRGAAKTRSAGSACHGISDASLNAMQLQWVTQSLPHPDHAMPMRSFADRSHRSGDASMQRRDAARRASPNSWAERDADARRRAAATAPTADNSCRRTDAPPWRSCDRSRLDRAVRPHPMPAMRAVSVIFTVHFNASTIDASDRMQFHMRRMDGVHATRPMRPFTRGCSYYHLVYIPPVTNHRWPPGGQMHRRRLSGARNDDPMRRNGAATERNSHGSSGMSPDACPTCSFDSARSNVSLAKRRTRCADYAGAATKPTSPSSTMRPSPMPPE